MVNSSKLTLLSDLTENFKLNPGDKYIIERSSGDAKGWDDTIKYNKYENAWQHASVYVFTESSKLYNIDDYINFRNANAGTYTSVDFKDVSWDVPGWLAVKTVPNVMKEFNCFITDMTTTHTADKSTTTMSLKFQSIWDHDKYSHIINVDKNSENYNLSLMNNLGYMIYDYSDDKNFNIFDEGKIN